MLLSSLFRVCLIPTFKGSAGQYVQKKNLLDNQLSDLVFHFHKVLGYKKKKKKNHYQSSRCRAVWL